MRTAGVVKFRSHNLTAIFGCRQILLAVCIRLPITLKTLLPHYKGENKTIEFLSKFFFELDELDKKNFEKVGLKSGSPAQFSSATSITPFVFFISCIRFV